MILDSLWTSNLLAVYVTYAQSIYLTIYTVLIIRFIYFLLILSKFRFFDYLFLIVDRIYFRSVLYIVVDYIISIFINSKSVKL